MVLTRDLKCIVPKPFQWAPINQVTVMTTQSVHCVGVTLFMLKEYWSERPDKLEFTVNWKDHAFQVSTIVVV